MLLCFPASNFSTTHQQRGSGRQKFHCSNDKRIHLLINYFITLLSIYHLRIGRSLNFNPFSCCPVQLLGQLGEIEDAPAVDVDMK